MKNRILPIFLLMAFVGQLAAQHGSFDKVIIKAAGQIEVKSSGSIKMGATVNEFSNDPTLGDSSNIALPTEAAVNAFVKAYVPTAIPSLTASLGIEKVSNNFRLGGTYMGSHPGAFTSNRKLNIGSFSWFLGRNADSTAFVFDAANRLFGIGRAPLTAAGNHVLQMASTNSYKLGIRDDADTYYQYELESSGGGGLFRMRRSTTSQMSVGWSASLSGWRFSSNSDKVYLNESTGGATTTPVWNVQSTYTIAPGSPSTVNRYYWGFNASPTFSANSGGEFREVAFNPTIVNNSTNAQTTVQAWFGASISGTAAEANTAIKIDNTVGVGINQVETAVENSFMGNTGIGVAAASVTQKLHVSGNARVTGAIYDSNNSPGTSGEVLTSTVTGTDWATPVTGCSQSITQASHGFIVGTPLYWNGTAYADITGNFASVTTPSGIVTSVTSSSVFVLTTCGAIASDLGLADGFYYATNGGLSTTAADPEMPMFKAEGANGIVNPMLAFTGGADPLFTITTSNGANDIESGETFVLRADSSLYTSHIGGDTVTDVRLALDRLQNGSTYIVADGTADTITIANEHYTVVVNTAASAETIRLPTPAALYDNVVVTIKQIGSASNAVTVAAVGGGSVFYDSDATSTSSTVSAGGGAKSYQQINLSGTRYWIVY